MCDDNLEWKIFENDEMKMWTYSSNFQINSWIQCFENTFSEGFSQISQGIYKPISNENSMVLFLPKANCYDKGDKFFKETLEVMSDQSLPKYFKSWCHESIFTKYCLGNEVNNLAGCVASSIKSSTSRATTISLTNATATTYEATTLKTSLLELSDGTTKDAASSATLLFNSSYEATTTIFEETVGTTETAGKKETYIEATTATTIDTSFSEMSMPGEASNISMETTSSINIPFEATSTIIEGTEGTSIEVTTIEATSSEEATEILFVPDIDIETDNSIIPSTRESPSLQSSNIDMSQLDNISMTTADSQPESEDNISNNIFTLATSTTISDLETKYDDITTSYIDLATTQDSNEEFSTTPGPGTFDFTTEYQTNHKNEQLKGNIGVINQAITTEISDNTYPHIINATVPNNPPNYSNSGIGLNVTTEKDSILATSIIEYPSTKLKSNDVISTQNFLNSLESTTTIPKTDNNLAPDTKSLDKVTTTEISNIGTASPNSVATNFNFNNGSVEANNIEVVLVLTFLSFLIFFCCILVYCCSKW